MIWGMEPDNPYGTSQELPASTYATGWPSNGLVWFYVWFYTIAILWGAQGAVASVQSGGDAIFQLSSALCLGMWAVADARQRQKPIPFFQQQWFFIFAGLVVPAYVIVTRGWKGIGWVALSAVSWFAAATLAMHVAGFIYFGSAWWAALGFAN